MKSYIGFSKIEPFNRCGSSGGVASTLSFFAIEKNYVKAMLVSRRYKTVIAETKEDLIESCGSIYEDFKYKKLKGDLLGQVGKPCNIDLSYKIRICLFCSGTRRHRKLVLTREKRLLTGLIDIPAKCFLCTDHLGRKANISIGDLHGYPKMNMIIAWNKQGADMIRQASKENYLNIISIGNKILRERQPYLFKRGIKFWKQK